MGVEVLFRCDGCEATAKGTDTLKREFRSVSGREWGFGRPVPVNSVDDIVPDGWWAYDPYTYCTYCPECRGDICAQEQAGE